MSLKTLHLVNAWHANSGGISTFYRALIGAANRAGQEIRLVVPGEADGLERVGPHARIYTIRAPRAPFTPSYRILYPSTYLTAGSPLRKILAEERPDLVEICDKYTLPYLGGLIRTGRLGPNPPVVIGMSCERFDDTVSNYANGGAPGRAFARWYMNQIYYPLCDHHITVSAYTAAELTEAARGHVKVSREIWILPMGCDADTFHPRNWDESWRRELLGGERALVLYAGRLAREKNLPLLTEALRRLPGGFRAVIAGSGPLREQVERDCAGRAVFIDHIRDRERLAALYASCDVFAHPNPREPFGIAPLEAMASGLGLVAPNAGGVLEYANESNAWLVPPEPSAFAAAIVEATAGGRREEARSTAERFAWPLVAARFIELYRRIAAARSPIGCTVKSA